MEAEILGRRIEERFADSIKWTAHSVKRLYVSCPPEKFDGLVALLREQCPTLRIGTSTGHDVREGVSVMHHFVVNGTPLVVTVKMLGMKPEPVLPSLGKHLPGAIWIEREISDLLGVRFEGHPDPRRLLKSRAFGEEVHPLRRDFDVKEFKERIGHTPEF